MALRFEELRVLQAAGTVLTENKLAWLETVPTI